MSFGLDPDDEKARSLDSWNRLNAIKTIEIKMVTFLKEGPNQITWELACEEAGETDSNILKYGKGRH